MGYRSQWHLHRCKTMPLPPATDATSRLNTLFPGAQVQDVPGALVWPVVTSRRSTTCDGEVWRHRIQVELQHLYDNVDIVRSGHEWSAWRRVAYPENFARGEQHGQQSHMDGRCCRGPGRGQRGRKLRSLARSRDNWCLCYRRPRL